MSSCSAFPLSPVLHLEIYFECWFRSAQIHSAVGHLQAAGQLLAHTLLCRGPLLMGFFMLRLPRSWYHMSPQEQGSGAHRWPTATTHGERPRAPCQEVGHCTFKRKKKTQHFPGFERENTTNPSSHSQKVQRSFWVQVPRTTLWRLSARSWLQAKQKRFPPDIA